MTLSPPRTECQTFKWRKELRTGVKLRPVLLVAAILVIASGMLLVLLQPGGRPGQEGEQPTGLSPTTIAGILVVVIGLALLILGLLNPASVARAAPPTASETPDSAPIVQAPSPPSAMSSDTEAAVVRLLDANERLLYIRLRDAGGVALQRDIVAWRTFSPAKVSRILDRLEAKGLLVRERHGATNRVRLVRHAVISQK